MGNPGLKCLQPAAKAVYRYLIQQGYTKQLDSGFRVIDYHNTANHKGKLIGAGDGEVVCEELWENSLIILDELGEKEEAVQKYQELRRLIETQTRRPIPWIFEASTVKVSLSAKQRSLEIRQKVQGAIDALEKFLAPIKNQDPAKFQRCLIACLYWFCWVDEKKNEKEIKEIKIPKDVEKFLRDEGLEAIASEFGTYLSQKGGLGLRQIGGKDAPTERTAFETVNAKVKLGWCTEQAEVLYAVLRTAGVKAHFVEPKLPIEYYKTLPDPFEPSIPLPAHVAAGVQVEIMDENGKPKIWILDLALKMFQADYVEKGYPYWELSLRQLFMAHLSNLGTDQTSHRKYGEAEENFKLALDFGHDSTAYLAMGNYFYLLRKNPPLKRNEVYNRKMMYGKMAIEIRPDFAIFQLNWGIYLAKQRNWETSINAFLESIDSDPRNGEAYRNFSFMLYHMRRLALDKFPKASDMFKEQMRKVVDKYPFYKNRVREGFKIMRIAIGSKKPSDEQLIEFIKQLEKDLGLNELIKK